MHRGHGARHRVPGGVAELQRDLADDILGDHQVHVTGVGEQAEHVGQVGAPDREIDRRTAVPGLLATQVAGGPAGVLCRPLARAACVAPGLGRGEH